MHFKTHMAFNRLIIRNVFRAAFWVLIALNLKGAGHSRMPTIAVFRN